MGLIGIVIPDELEEQLRDRAKRKGDLGKIVSEALREHFKKEKTE